MISTISLSNWLKKLLTIVGFIGIFVAFVYIVLDEEYDSLIGSGCNIKSDLRSRTLNDKIFELWG